MSRNKQTEKSRIVYRLLERLLVYSIRNAAAGDFIEQTVSIRKEKGPLIAWIWIWSQVLQIVPSVIVYSTLWSIAMFQNYFKTAFRNLKKTLGYSVINVVGLAVGMACCILILLYVVDELSYDRYHEHADDVFRVATRGRLGERMFEITTIQAAMGPQLVEDFTEVETFVRIRETSPKLIRYEDKKFYESKFLYVDRSLFDVFSFELVSGDPRTALEAPYSLVMTPEAAAKYFGREDPVGKIVRINNEQDFTVTGVIAKPPVNSHFTFDVLASFETLYREIPDELGWVGWNFQTYIRLRHGSDPKALEQKLVGFNDKYIGKILASFGGEITNFLQPLAAIHLHSHLDAELDINSDIRYVYLFTAVAAFILIIACINFMNLSTARSAKRAREVGLRKVVGATRGMLVRQYLGESILMAAFAMCLALGIVSTVLPAFNNIAARQIRIGSLLHPWIILGFSGIVIIVGLLAGSYPALLLSGFRATSVLKGVITKGKVHARFRSVLVVFQFAISITLIIGTVIVFHQLNFMRNEKLGFEKEQRLIIPLRSDDARNQLRVYKAELSGVEGVLDICGSRTVPGEENYNANPFFPEGWSDEESFIVDAFYTDDQYLKTYNIKLVDGRGFSDQIPSDIEDAVLINQTAANVIGWDHPVGKQLATLTSSRDLTQRKVYTIIGVIEDIHYRSVHHAIAPSLLTFSPDYARKLTLRLDSRDIPNTIKKIERKWEQIAPDHPFEYTFFDDYYDALYRSEERLGNILRIFTVLAILVGSLGLFGLSSYAAEQRTKEIGIRKVLGSSSAAIVLMLSRNFIVLVGMANAIAWPVAYFTMRRWLVGFPYRTDIRFITFIIAGLVSLLIALITVSYRAVRAAWSNPVDALRYE